MSDNKLKIATRKSRLAIWQAEHVRARLEQQHPDLNVVLIPMLSTGDRLSHARLADVGGKGLFIKELEAALLQRRADIAVHSMKDVPVDLPSGLTIAVVLPREDPRDVFLSPDYASIHELPADSTVGTSSLRRQSQLRALRPDLVFVDLRGNVDTRMRKLSDAEFHAIVLAAAGLKRLGLDAAISGYFSLQELLPAIGQGAIGIECRSDDYETQHLIAGLNDIATSRQVAAERAINEVLQGDCHSPMAGHARSDGSEIVVDAMIASFDGTKMIKDSLRGPATQAAQLGTQLGHRLLGSGARELLDNVK